MHLCANSLQLAFVCQTVLRGFCMGTFCQDATVTVVLVLVMNICFNYMSCFSSRSRYKVKKKELNIKHTNIRTRSYLRGKSRKYLGPGIEILRRILYRRIGHTVT